MNTFGPICSHVTDPQVPSKSLCKIERASLPGLTRGPRAWKESRYQLGSPRKILRRVWFEDSDATKKSGCWFWSWVGNTRIGLSISPMLLARLRPKPMTHWHKEHELATRLTCISGSTLYRMHRQTHMQQFLEKLCGPETSTRPQAQSQEIFRAQAHR